MNALNLRDLSDKNPNSHPSFKNFETALPPDNGFYAGLTFHHTLSLESKRAKRSQRPLLLILLNVGDLLLGPENQGLVKKIEKALSSCVRETDIKGWYQEDKIICILFTEIEAVDEIIKEKISLKIQNKLFEAVGPEALELIGVAYHIFPGTHPENTPKWFHWTCSQQLIKKNHFQPFLPVKRVAGLLGGLLRLFLLSPCSSPAPSASKTPGSFKHRSKAT